MAHKEMRDGRCANAFSDLARVLQLEHVRCTGWPCLVLNVQFRTVQGGFNPAREVIYSDPEGSNVVVITPYTASIESLQNTFAHNDGPVRRKVVVNTS